MSYIQGAGMPPQVAAPPLTATIRAAALMLLVAECVDALTSLLWSGIHWAMQADVVSPDPETFGTLSGVTSGIGFLAALFAYAALAQLARVPGASGLAYGAVGVGIVGWILVLIPWLWHQGSGAYVVFSSVRSLCFAAMGCLVTAVVVKTAKALQTQQLGALPLALYIVIGFMVFLTLVNRLAFGGMGVVSSETAVVGMVVGNVANLLSLARHVMFIAAFWQLMNIAARGGGMPPQGMPPQWMPPQGMPPQW